MLYLLDTNICIYLIKNKPIEVKKHFDRIPIEKVAISSIVLSELSYGVCKSEYSTKNQKALNNFIAPFEIISYDEKACSHYGKIRAELEKAGKIIDSMDLMIAAHALSIGATIVTNNTKEFSRVKGLDVENWIH